MQKHSENNDLIMMIVSAFIQIPLAVLLGHFYDQTIFLQTGYLVNSGLNPYQPHLITIFQNPYLTGTNNIIGYPPPWPFLLGLIYRLTYNQLPNLFLYNFATKIPIILSNIALAYLTRMVMQQQNLSPQTIRFAWLFLLFNPFTLLTTIAWGQFDTVIALLCLIGVCLLGQGKPVQSAMVLAFSFVLKPILLPLLGLPLLYCIKGSHRKIFWTVLVSGVVFSTLLFAPFYLMNWAAPFSLGQVGSFFTMTGGMTLFNLIDVFRQSAILPPNWWSVSYLWINVLWIPALLLGYYWVYRHPPKNFLSAAKAALILLLIFFLSRTWLSEQNLNLLFPFMLILLGSGNLKPKSFNLFWVLALVFLVLNMSVLQLLYLVYPPAIPLKEAFDATFGVARLTARFVVTIVWFFAGVNILIVVLGNQRLFARKSLNEESPN